MVQPEKHGEILLRQKKFVGCLVT